MLLGNFYITFKHIFDESIIYAYYYILQLNKKIQQEEFIYAHL